MPFYTGMMTDTGNFTYNSNYPEIYITIAELIKKGIDKDWIYARIHNTNSENKLRLNGYAIDPEDGGISRIQRCIDYLVAERIESI